VFTLTVTSAAFTGDIEHSKIPRRKTLKESIDFEFIAATT
jgi:hypothetical protein